MNAIDHLSILELYASYNKAIDGGDAAAWAATFAEGGVFDHPSREWRGDVELRRFIDERREGLARASSFEHRHWNDAIAIEGDGLRSTATCDLVVTASTKDGHEPIIVARGAYRDELVRQEDGWRFVRRTLTVL